MELVYSLLKVLSLLATGTFGVLALLTKFKDDQGKLTRWGKIAIGGILISSGISLVLYTLEASKAKAAAIKSTAEAEQTKQRLEIIVANATETAKQQERSLAETENLKSGLEKSLKRSDEIAKGMDKSLFAQSKTLGLTMTTLQDTGRLLHPIDSLQLRIHLTIPLETPGVRQYVARISGELDPLFQSPENKGNWNEWNRRLSPIGLEAPMPGAIGIPENSTFHPTEKLDGRTADILGIMWVELAFYHRPIDPKKFSPFDSRIVQGNQADIRVRFESAPVSLVTNPLLLHYFGSKDDLEIRGDMVTHPQEWELSDDVLSILDLPSGQLFITLGPLGRFKDKDEDWFPERQRFFFSNLFLRISKRMFEISREELKQYQTEAGSPYWCYRFPVGQDKNRSNAKGDFSIRKARRDSVRR